ncbi:unnamed protein product [Trifolium pratense]|uniref:Uncharacterized protein n=1 Tax=Trifolium pratense TaxID=57577 RepID=A0ACB0K0B1_TRIPR|nr:unnamed protein product [Trifolium pratense]
MIFDLCCSRALIGGAVELIGHNTRNFISDKTRVSSNVYLQHLQINKPSGRSLDIMITACQNNESTIYFFYCAINLHIFWLLLMSIIQKKKEFMSISNFNLDN